MAESVAYRIPPVVPSTVSCVFGSGSVPAVPACGRARTTNDATNNSGTSLFPLMAPDDIG